MREQMETKKFFVKVNDPDVSELIQKKALGVGYSKQISFGTGLLKFNWDAELKPMMWESDDAEHYPEYTIDQALKYFSELKAEKEKPKYKVGDWIYLLMPGYGFTDDLVGSVIQLQDLTGADYLGFGDRDFAITVKGHKRAIGNGTYRHATPSEIEEATKPKFKVGDYVITKSDSKSADGRRLAGKALCVGTIKSNFDGEYFEGYSDNNETGIWLTDIERLATQEEIESAQKIMIAGYEMKHEKETQKIEFGCAYFSRWQFRCIQEFNEADSNRSNRKIKSITLDSGVTITMEEIEKILEATK
jgi:hypothetical protein